MEKKNENIKEEKLRRELGLGSVVFFIFGYVVGAGILIQTGVTAGITGPALWLSFIIAGIPNVISAILICYVVSAFPVSGGAWVYSSRLGSPFIGFLVAISIIFHIIGALALLAIGFGTYFEVFIPGSLFIASIMLILIFLIINLVGIKIASWAQILMAICGDFLVIFIFIIFGLPQIDINKLSGAETGGMFPNGMIGIFMGAIILSFSYAGFPSIIEIGGEIKNPRKNIPRGLILALIIITTVYILVAIVMTGSMDYRQLGEGATLIDVAQLFFPAWFLIALNVMILIAIASTLHGVLLAYSRDLYSSARDHMFPNALSKLSRYQTPHWALIFFAISAICMLFILNTIVELSVLCTFTMTIASLVIAYIPFKLRKKYPDLEEKSIIKLSNRTLIILLILNVGYSAFSIIIMILLSPIVVLMASIFYGFGFIYYFVRKKWLLKHGIDLDEICKHIPEETFEV
ncbi:MAG: APC family permease [Promethearchaeota archaeon]